MRRTNRFFAFGAAGMAEGYGCTAVAVAGKAEGGLLNSEAAGRGRFVSSATIGWRKEIKGILNWLRVWEDVWRV